MNRLLLFLPLLVGSTLVLAETTRGLDPGPAWSGRLLLAAIVWLLLLPLGRADRGNGGSGGWDRGTPPPDPDGIEMDWREIYASARQAGHSRPAMAYREQAEPQSRPQPQLEPEPILAEAAAFREEARGEIAEIAAEISAWGENEPR